MYESQPPPWAITPAGPGSAIAITTRYSWLAFVLALFRPQITVNGRPVPAAWGRTVVPVPPGQHHVQVHVPYLLPPRVGPAETLVPVYPGQVVEVEYRAPVIAWIGGAIGPAPQPVRGLAAGIALLVVPLVVMFCIAGALTTVTLTQDDRNAAQPVNIPPPPTFGTPRTSGTTPGPSPEPGTGADEPTLRAVPDRTVTGPSYAAGDKTFTMTLKDFPFAFRTPATWGCLSATVDIPDARAWVCVDEGNPFDAGAAAPDRSQRAQIMLRQCPAPCGKGERATLDRDWFDGQSPKAVDERTSFVETARDDKGRYTIDMSHFFPGDGGTQWQVAVWAYSDPADRAVPQKIVNDMLTQAG